MLLFKQEPVDQIVILTGAGVSAESGLATFRDADGLWEKHDPMTVATPEAFARDPALVYRFYNARRAQLGEAEPNAAHRAIARLQDVLGERVFLVTQNVDDLHERAGSAQVCHMHGELHAMRCIHCGLSMRAAATFDGSSGCPACEHVGALRPDIVWFGEMPYAMDIIESRLSGCSLFIAVGTSGTVYPAAGFVQLALASGAITIEVNAEASEVADLFQYHYTGPATREMARLTQELIAAAAG